MGRRVHQIQRRPGAGDLTDQTFAETHARLVYGVGIQAFGGEQFQFFRGTAQIDRTDLGDHRRRNDMHHGVEARLGRLALFHRLADLPQQPALAADRTWFRHARPLVVAQPRMRRTIRNCPPVLLRCLAAAWRIRQVTKRL